MASAPPVITPCVRELAARYPTTIVMVSLEDLVRFHGNAPDNPEKQERVRAYFERTNWQWRADSPTDLPRVALGFSETKDVAFLRLVEGNHRVAEASAHDGLQWVPVYVGSVEVRNVVPDGWLTRDVPDAWYDEIVWKQRDRWQQNVVAVLHDIFGVHCLPQNQLL